MRVYLQLLFTIGLIFLGTVTYSQTTLETRLRELPENTKITVNYSLKLPEGAKSVWLDNGKGKICSCQLLIAESNNENRVYQSNQTLSLKKITIKGLFDGSQMHVARVYFHNTDDYFKFKCYARDILVKHIAEYLNIDNIGAVAKED
ncbi:hypothetical protein [Aureispira anguillae]|uniref:Uncharacterized protein n=1 Tax=Aureispira anguillae TaxID=2864201 RepID=A0A916DTT2_9BACT|nr:hypothetical protein [Aureispira anguillae]BDS12072.1 hypothetical protein AsAng_0027870 [Aureispira anguillae]